MPPLYIADSRFRVLAIRACISSEFDRQATALKFFLSAYHVIGVIKAMNLVQANKLVNV